MAPGPAKQFDTEQALDAAICVFQARGYEAASLAELIAEMGIGKKSLYDTFGSKRELFLLTLDRYARKQHAAIREQLEQPGSALQNLKDLLLSWQKSHAEADSQGCLFGNNMADFVQSDGEIAQRLSEAVGQLEDLLFRTIKRAAAAEEIAANVKPRDLARMIVCLTQGMALLSRISANSPYSRSSVTAILALLERD